MDDIELAGKRVLIREDLNVPIKNGVITDATRIEKALPTLQKALKENACVMVLSHLGRPTEGEFSEEYSLTPVADALSEALGQEVLLVRDWLDGVNVAPGQIVLAENVRFNRGETKNDAELAKRMAAQCDVFVMDAFATAHRAQASTVGVAEFAPIACAGPLLAKELDALSAALTEPKRPLTAVVGGSKVSTKLHLLDSLVKKVDRLIVGGGIANTFLFASDHPIGKSLAEESFASEAQRILLMAQEHGVDIPLPIDVTVAKEFSPEAPGVVKTFDAIEPDDMILDVGPQTAASYESMMLDSETIVWNGPVGVFEFPAFAAGTRAIGDAIASSTGYSIAGGGDTLAALSAFDITEGISYISTGGGAFLAFLEGKPLPAVAVLEKRAQ